MNETCNHGTMTPSDLADIGFTDEHILACSICLVDLLKRIQADIEMRADMRVATAVDLSDGLYAELCRVTSGNRSE